MYLLGISYNSHPILTLNAPLPLALYPLLSSSLIAPVLPFRLYPLTFPKNPKTLLPLPLIPPSTRTTSIYHPFPFHPPCSPPPHPTGNRSFGIRANQVAMSGSTTSPSQPSPAAPSRPEPPSPPFAHSPASEGPPEFYLSRSFEVCPRERPLPRDYAINTPPPPLPPLGRIVEVHCYDERRARGIPMTVPKEVIEDKIKALRLMLGLPALPVGRPLLEPSEYERFPFLESIHNMGLGLNSEDDTDCTSSDSDLDLDF